MQLRPTNSVMPSMARTPALLLATLLVVMMGACSHTGTIRERAAFQFNCPEDQVVVTPGPNVGTPPGRETSLQQRVDARGCGQEQSFLCYKHKKLLGRSVCRQRVSPADDAPVSALMTRGVVTGKAAIELGCPEDDLDVRRLGKGAYGISGCGRRAVYVCEQGTLQSTCTRDSPVLEGQAP